MKYKKKKRFASYYDLKSKMYLRFDFHKECAYCRVREDDISILPLVDGFFEKDHFIPQAVKLENMTVHAYENLRYSCRKCNNAKKKKMLTVDPYRMDVFSRSNPQISGGKRREGFIYYPVTEIGKRYCEDLQLNSLYQVKLRRAVYEKRKTEVKQKKLLHDLKKISASCSSKISVVMGEKNEAGKDEILCGYSQGGMVFCQLGNLLKCNQFIYEILFEEYNIDLKLVFQGEMYYCEVIIVDGKKPKRIKKKINLEIIRNWTDPNRNYGIIYFYPEENVGYLYILSPYIKSCTNAVYKEAGEMKQLF